MVVIHKKKAETDEEKALRLAQEDSQAQGLQDEYQAKGFELVSWVQHHKAMVSLLILAIFLGGGSFSAYLYYQQRSSESASTAYLAALKPIDSTDKDSPENKEKLATAQKELASIAETHANTQVAALANLYAGHLALENSDDGALGFYQRAVPKISKSDNLYPLVMIGLGYAQDRQGKTAEALASFDSVVALKSAAGKDLALWEAARLSKQLNNSEKASSLIARLLQEFPASIYEKNAKRLKESL